jgi:Fe-S-cluster-containing dehydrogenase component
MAKYGILIDYQYCTGCHSCEVACQQENGYEAEQFGITVTEHVLKGKNGLMIDYVPFLTDLCNLCMARVGKGMKPSCVKHCQSRCMVFGTVNDLVDEARKKPKSLVFFK